IVPYLVLNRCQAGEDKERSRRKDEYGKRFIGRKRNPCIASEKPDGCISIRQDLESEDLPCTDQFSHNTDASQSHCESESHADPVKDRRQDRILGRVALCSSEDDAVYNDKRDV